MTPLNQKLVRDLLHLRGQVIAVALVVACGIATYVTMRGSYDALVESRDGYYEAYRFADVFADLKRAPESITAEIQNIPGVATTQTRVVLDVTLDVPGLDEPATRDSFQFPSGKRRFSTTFTYGRGVMLNRGRATKFW